MSVKALIKLLRTIQNHNVIESKKHKESLMLLLKTVQSMLEDGLSSEEMEALVMAFTDVDIKKLSASAQQDILRCLIPTRQPTPTVVRELMLWLVSYIDDLPFTALKTALMWFIGMLEFGIIEVESLTWAYEILFKALNRERLEGPSCKLLQLLTVPELITRFRVVRLLRLKEKDRRPYVLALLSLYKTLRPDKVPEPIPVLSQAMLGNAGEVDLMAAIQRLCTRLEDGDRNVSSPKKNKICWAIERPAKGQKQDGYAMVPPLSFIKLSTLENIVMNPVRLMVENKTMLELGCYLLTSKCPAQALSLLSSSGGLMYLQFAEEKVRQRFRHTLLQNLMLVIDRRDRRRCSEASMLQLLRGLVRMQESHQSSSAVITRFVSLFLQCQGDEQMTTLVLELMTRPFFSTYNELYASILLPLEYYFVSSDLETRVFILKKVGEMILNLHWQVHHSPQEHLKWPAESTLRHCGELHIKLCNIAIASEKPSSCLLLIDEALSFYKTLMGWELKAVKLNLWTVPPPSLMLACLLSSQDWLLDSACDLLLKHRFEVFQHYKYKSRLFRAQIRQINEIAGNFLHILLMPNYFQDTTPVLLLREVPGETLTRLREMCDDQESLGLAVHPALAPQRLLLQNLLGFCLDTKDLEIYCENHLPHIHAFINAFQVGGEEKRTTQ